MPKSIVVEALRDAIEAARKDLTQEPTPEMAESLIRLVRLYTQRLALPTTGDQRRISAEIVALRARVDQISAKLKTWEDNADARPRGLGTYLGVRR